MNKNSGLLHKTTKTGFPEEKTIKDKNSATIPVADVAKILGVFCQTVRLLLQTQAVEWGIAYRLPHSRHYSYLIYAEKFYSEIGFVGGEREC